MNQKEQYAKVIEEVLSQYSGDRRHALAALQDLQKNIGYIPPQALAAAAKHFEVPLSQLYAMATFYRALSLEPKGRHIIKLCDGTACHIRGSVVLIQTIERLLDIKPGETTEDGQFTLELVNCLGSCAIAPVMVVDQTWYGNMTPEKIPEILEAHRKGVAAG